MKLTYLLDNVRKETSFDNDDVSFVTNEDNNHHLIKVIAKKDIILSNAIIEYPYEFKDGDQAFCNGYNAWTYTRLVDNKYKEMNIYKRLPKFLLSHIAADKYGDYMKLPPESERKWNHHPLIMDFEHNYEELLNDE